MPLAAGETVRRFLERTLLPLLQDLPTSRRGAVVRLLLTEGNRFPRLAEVYYRKVIAPGLAIFGSLAKHAVTTGELSSDALVRFPQLMIAPAILSIIWSGLFERFGHLDSQEMLRAYFNQVFSAATVVQKTLKAKRRSVANAEAKA
ncbi:MAG: TetR/AcrR family transcriptional regulator C-terminal ligand-binding domain-containing protein [Acidobacteriota bacterium]|nr:TetR/AcrR family transcriptional regulator C-terminal ligand-binding domain-containing protein [Acidobacteriota bacterium]